MKFFSFFKDNEQLLSLPEEKVITADELIQLIDIDELIKKTKQDAQDYLAKTKEEAKKIKKQAKEEGFQEGLEKFNKSVLHLDKTTKLLREEFKKKILPIALKAAKKILGEELELHPERITDIVIQSLKPVTQHRNVKIYVNKADIDILEKDKPKIKKVLDQVESFSIQERMDVQPGGCIIETEEGIINAQLENQWRALEAAFKAFMKQ